MEPTTPENIQAFFEELRTELGDAVNGDLVWTYFLVGDNLEKVEDAGEKLEEDGYDVAGIFEDQDQEGLYVIVVEKVETHTEETLQARCREVESFIAANGLKEFDGFEANPVGAELPSEGEVSNPELKEFIANFPDQISQEGAQQLGELLNSGFYVVPVLKAPEGGEGEMQLCVCDDDEGNEFLPIFTDLEEVNLWLEKESEVITISAGDAWTLALTHQENKGVVINPGSTGFPVTRDILEELLKDL